GRRIEAVGRAIVALVHRSLMFPADAEIYREAVCHSPVVLHKKRAIFGSLRAVRIDVVAAAGGQTQQEGSEILSERRRGGVIVGTPGPIGAVGVTAGRVSVRVGALAVITDIGAHLGAVIAMD